MTLDYQKRKLHIEISNRDELIKKLNEEHRIVAEEAHETNEALIQENLNLQNRNQNLADKYESLAQENLSLAVAQKLLSENHVLLTKEIEHLKDDDTCVICLDKKVSFSAAKFWY